MLPRLRFFVAQAILGLWRSVGVTILSVLTIGIALGILATFAMVISNLARIADELGKEVVVSAYLDRKLTPAMAEARAQEIARWPNVALTWVVSSTRAMEEFRQTLGRDALILDGVPNDVLPPSIEVRLVERPWATAEVRVLADRMLKLEGVEDVRYGQDDVERVHALLGFMRVAAYIVGTALCLAVILLVSNTIRLTVYARRDEIEIMTLIGATDFFVRAPFLIEGAVQGVLGAGVALLGLFALQNALIQGIQVGLSYAYGPIELQFVPLAFVGTLVSLGVALGLLGSLFAVGKFVKV